MHAPDRLAIQCSYTNSVDLPSIPPRLIVRHETPCLELEAEDADAFLGALSPVSGIGAKLPYRSLIYRGQVESSWSLVPTARRKHEWPPVGSRKPTPDIWANRLIWEANSLLSFCRNADRQGLAIPNLASLQAELPHFIGHIAGSNLDVVTTWPPVGAVPALALAQHYGLRTCLLDFTWNPYVAAYFAARGLMEHPEESDRLLCVWIIHDGNLLMNHWSDKHRVEILIPPASDNRTLQAQEGLFLWVPLRPESIALLSNEYTCATGESIDQILWQSNSGCSVTKLLLPQERAPMLLHKLVKLGYDSVRLFPSYEGAVRAVADHTWALIGHRP